jgi:hypothetical protein
MPEGAKEMLRASHNVAPKELLELNKEKNWMGIMQRARRRKVYFARISFSGG